MPKSKAMTYMELMRQSEALRAQAEQMRQKEKPEVVARIREAIAHYGIAAADLGLVGVGSQKKTSIGAPSRKSAKASKPKRLASSRFKDDAGHSWSGFGRRPKWLLDALAAGATLDSLKA
jgi:DNA-binding protein H-NS